MTTDAPAAAPTTTATPTTSPPSSAAPPDGGAPPAAPAAVAPAKTPISPALAELNRKEWSLRQEKKKVDDDRKSLAQEKADIEAKKEVWANDVQALIEAHGWTIENAIDFLAKGGATSAEGRVRALETKIQKQEREAKEKEAKATADAEEQQRAATRAEAVRHVHGEVAKLVKEDRFEFCAAEEGVADEVVKIIKSKWEKEGLDVSVEQALEWCEAVLDKKADRLAQSKKLKAKLVPAATTVQAKPEETRQNTTVPSATSKRTITIKQRQQAVAPMRKPADGRASRDDVTRAVAANLGKLFGGTQ